MSSTSVTTWLERLRADDPRAAQALWERFAERMLQAARLRLGAASRRVADEEDVVVVAFGRFLDGVRQGRFPRLADRDELWAVLLTLIQRTGLNQLRDLARQKRGGGVVARDSALKTADGRAIEPIDDGPTPEEAALGREELERLLAALEDDELRRIALGKLEGRTSAELAREMGCAEVTIERRLRLIRQVWRELVVGEA
jgi:DNA-directed RNA polymerase specialized sigma24 family protein